MNRQQLIIGAGAAAILLLAGLGALLYALSQGASLPGLTPAATPTPGLARFDIPKITVTPPADLAEVAAELRADYPELADLLENPELDSVYKDFYLAYQQGGQETALALARQRGIINNQDEIVMTLVLDTEQSDDLVTELEAEGVIVKERYKNLVSVAIPISLIQEQLQAENPRLVVERLTTLEHVIRVEFPHKARTKQGVILGQGVNVTFAANWHEQGLTGQGIKVGVLDLGFGGYQDLLGRELPENVTVAAFGDDSGFDREVHGTACAEIIHEMAPEAELYLAYYDGTDLTMGLATAWLLEQGVDIISNSTGNNGLTPLDGTGLAAEIVDEAQAAGVLWVNAAGNEATSHYRAPFSDADQDTLHDFLPDTPTLPFIPFGPGVETTVILSWDDWENADQDYDLALLDAEGNLLLKAEDAQDGGAGSEPVEGFVYEFDDDNVYLLVVQNYQGEARGDVTFDLFIHGGELHPDFLVAERSLSSPADAQGAFAVGAVNWATDALEPYSSQGPTADGRLKPDISAPSVVDTASYAPEAFDGTSAAAPHVAGAAALVLEAFPEFRGQPEQVIDFLTGRALDLGPSGPDNGFGEGRLDLGAGPQESEPPEATPAPAAEILPTSTPRPAVGLPGQPDEVAGQAGAAASPSEGGSVVRVIMLAGLCLICLSGGLFLALIAGVVMLFRR